MPSRWISFWPFQLAGWSLFIAATFPFKLLAFGNLEGAVQVTLVRDLPGFLLTILLRQFYLRWNWRKISAPRLICTILLLSCLAESIETLVALAFQPQLPPFFPAGSPIYFTAVFTFRATVFAFWSLLYIWIKDWKESQERERRLVQEENKRKEAELQMLRAQVNPHFLFNALNTIQAGLHRDQTALKTVVHGLADYLRYSLAHRGRHFVPMGHEFDAMMQYLIVEKGRYRDDLQVEGEIDEDARQIGVPGVILQPLVENAVRYGMEQSARPLRIRIAVRKLKDESLGITVENSGDWLEPGPRRADGTGGSGLETLRRRLELLYPGRHRLEIKKEPGQVSIAMQLDPGPDLPASV